MSQALANLAAGGFASNEEKNITCEEAVAILQERLDAAFPDPYNTLRLAVRRGLLDRIPLLFCGKTNLGDLRTLAGLVEAGLVRPPQYLPPQMRDLGTLAAWLCYANFLGSIDLERIEKDYAGVL